MQKRVKNARPDWEYFWAFEEAAGNYYPINSAIYIEDEKSKKRITLLNDRS